MNQLRYSGLVEAMADEVKTGVSVYFAPMRAFAQVVRAMVSPHPRSDHMVAKDTSGSEAPLLHRPSRRP